MNDTKKESITFQRRNLQEWLLIAHPEEFLTVDELAFDEFARLRTYRNEYKTIVEYENKLITKYLRSLKLTTIHTEQE